MNSTVRIRSMVRSARTADTETQRTHPPGRHDNARRRVGSVCRKQANNGQHPRCDAERLADGSPARPCAAPHQAINSNSPLRLTNESTNHRSTLTIHPITPTSQWHHHPEPYRPSDRTHHRTMPPSHQALHTPSHHEHYSHHHTQSTTYHRHAESTHNRRTIRLAAVACDRHHSIP